MNTDHEALVEAQFGCQAQTYLHSEVHSRGADLQRLAEWLNDAHGGSLLDVGCGAGHASFVAATQVAEVTACDLSEEMLAVVRLAAVERGLTNISTCRGSAEKLPFADNSFDCVISRYSAHHWHDVRKALCEIKRVLKPGGTFILMDIASPGKPLLDVWLQTTEMLRDPSHIRNYSQGEWLNMLNDCGMMANRLVSERLSLDFTTWVARMNTPDEAISAIRYLQRKVSDTVKQHYSITEEGSFVTDTIMFMAQ